MRRLIFLMMLIAGPAAAELPALFDVTGVAADDVLNIRENPRATGAKVGDLAPDRTGVEVVELSESGDWGRVNSGEGSGWVRMTFLSEQPGPGEGETLFGQPLACSGTEPFWSMAFAPNVDAVFAPIDSEPVAFTVAADMMSSNVAGQAQAVIAGAYGGETVTGIVRRAICSDGMSDRVFGLSLDMVMTDGDGSRLLSGCCTLETN